jgi:hypothetical protein
VAAQQDRTGEQVTANSAGSGTWFAFRPWLGWVLHGLVLLGQAVATAQVLPHSSGWGAMLVHAALLGGLVCTQILLWRLPGLPHGVVRTGHILLASLVQFALLAGYLGNMLSRQYLHTALNLNMMAAYLDHAEHVSNAANVSILVPALGVAALALIALAVNFAIFRGQPTEGPPAWIPLLGVLASGALYLALPAQYRENEFLHRTIYALPVEIAPEGLLAFRDPPQPPAYAPPGEAFSPRPLVLISIDSLRADAMQVYGNPTGNTPFLQSLADDGRLEIFRNSHSVCAFSYCGIVGLVSSRYWRDLDHSPDTLMDALAHYGYRNHALLSGDHSRYYGLSRQFGSNIDVFRDGTSSPQDYPNDDRLLHRWMAELPAPEGERNFYWFHLMDVHSLGLRDPERHEAIRGRASEIAIRDSDLLARLEGQGGQVRDFAQRYHNGIGQADETIRRVFDWLEEQGLLDTALVVITADHGEFLGENGATGHGGLPWEPLTRVPLMVYDPLGGEWPDVPVSSTVDVAPTLLAAIGAPVPTQWSGIALQAPGERCAVRAASRQGEVLIGDTVRIWRSSDGRLAEMPLIEREGWQNGGSAANLTRLYRQLDQCSR